MGEKRNYGLFDAVLERLRGRPEGMMVRELQAAMEHEWELENKRLAAAIGRLRSDGLIVGEKTSIRHPYGKTMLLRYRIASEEEQREIKEYRRFRGTRLVGEDVNYSRSDMHWNELMARAPIAYEDDPASLKEVHARMMIRPIPDRSYCGSAAEMCAT